MKKVIFYICVAAFCFGTMEVALKIGGNDLDPFQLTFLRFFGGGLVLLPFAIRELRKPGAHRLNAADLRYLLILGILCIPISMLIFQFGLMRTNATTAAIMICLSPVFTMVFAHMFLKEPVNRNNLLAMLLGLLGILVLINPFDLAPGNTPAGIMLTLLGTVVFSLYSVLGKVKIGRIGAFAQTSLSFIMGSGGLLLCLMLLQRPIVQGINLQNIGLVLYAAIIVTGLGYLFYFLAIDASNAITGSVTFLLKPVIAPLAAFLVLQEKSGPMGLLGIGLVLAASIINLKALQHKQN